MIASYGVNRRLADQLTFLRTLVGTALQFFPFNLHASRRKDAAHRGSYLWANPFARYQSDFMCHRCIILYAKLPAFFRKLVGRVSTSVCVWNASPCSRSKGLL